jgi:N,N'-diacetyllegionaminate synthase
MSCFVIAEIGVNHNGDEALAAEMVLAAAGAGADAVKFQTFRADALVSSAAQTVAYQRERTGSDDQLSMLRRLELPMDAFRRLAEQCARLGVEFMSTPFDAASADALVALGMKRLKVPSGELTNLPLLRHVAGLGVPLIVSTGMSSMAEVEEALNSVRFAGATDVTLLHCTSSYPTALSDVNLRAMDAMREQFSVSIGYSDHTEGLLVPVAAVARGATVIEKHFTTDRSLPGPDQRASIEPAEFAEMVKTIRLVELALGSGAKEPRPDELAVRAAVRRSVVLRHDVAVGHVISADDVELLRPGTGIQPADLGRVIGARMRRTLARGAMPTWDDLEV